MKEMNEVVRSRESKRFTEVPREQLEDIDGGLSVQAPVNSFRRVIRAASLAAFSKVGVFRLGRTGVIAPCD